MVLDCCKELTGCWSWDTDIPFSDIITYLSSYENNPSKNLKLAYIASNIYQRNKAYGLSPERKKVVKALYKNKLPLDNQDDLDNALKQISVFINDEYYIEEAILAQYGTKLGLQYNNSNTHSGLGRPLTQEELEEPDFINNKGTKIEAKMCWETENSKFPGSTTLDYTIDPLNFDEAAFNQAFSKLDQIKSLHKTRWCLCVVKKSATKGYLVGVECVGGKAIRSKLFGSIKVLFLRPEQKQI
jgi:hypothetical protein